MIYNHLPVKYLVILSLISCNCPYQVLVTTHPTPAKDSNMADSRGFSIAMALALNKNSLDITDTFEIVIKCLQ